MSHESIIVITGDNTQYSKASCHTCPGKKPVVTRVKVSKECDNDDSCTCQTFVVVSGCSSISPVQAGVISFGAVSKGTETLYLVLYNILSHRIASATDEMKPLF